MEKTEGMIRQLVVTRVVNGWVVDKPVSEGVVETRVVESSDTDHLVEALEELFEAVPVLEDDESEVPPPPKKKKKGKKPKKQEEPEDDDEDEDL